MGKWASLLSSVVGRCGTQRKKDNSASTSTANGNEKNSASSRNDGVGVGVGGDDDGRQPANSSTSQSGTLLEGRGYVEVNARASVLIDATSLEMGREAISSLNKILQRERDVLAKAVEYNADSVRERGNAEVLVKDAEEERDGLLKQVMELKDEIERVKERSNEVSEEIFLEKERQSRIETEEKRISEEKVQLASIEKRNKEIDQEILRAQSLLRTERSARIKLQARLKADIQQSTLPFSQQEDRLQNDITETSGRIREEKKEQDHFKQKRKQLKDVIEKASSEYQSLLTQRRQMMSTIGEEIGSDSPLKAEYRRARERLQNEKQEAEQLLRIYNSLDNKLQKQVASSAEKKKKKSARELFP